MKQFISFIAALLLATTATAQTRADIFDANVLVTWLGLDFSQAKFIGVATQWQDAGEITNSQMRDRYFPAWNNLFINEKEKFNVADATGRTEMNYAIDVTEWFNNKLTGNFFETDGNKYQLLTEQKVKELVKKYNFKGNKGIGLMFFVEGMSKGKEEASMWVTFVNMNTKTVLLTKRMTGKTGASIGFRNYWAKPFSNVLKDMKKQMKNWK